MPLESGPSFKLLALTNALELCGLQEIHVSVECPLGMLDIETPAGSDHGYAMHRTIEILARHAWSPFEAFCASRIRRHGQWGML